MLSVDYVFVEMFLASFPLFFIEMWLKLNTPSSDEILGDFFFSFQCSEMPESHTDEG